MLYILLLGIIIGIIKGVSDNKDYDSKKDYDKFINSKRKKFNEWERFFDEDSK